MDDFRQYGDIPRFQLDRRPGRSRMKKKCPGCGKDKCLTLYVDVQTGDPIGDDFGRCDHERKCGYDKKPRGDNALGKELWISNNKVRSAFKHPLEREVSNFIPYPEVAKTINPSYNNVFFSFLAKIWGENKVSDTFRRYNIGTMDLWSWKGCCVFWQMDKDFICRTGKIMEFYIKKDDAGAWNDVKRVKEGADNFPHVTFYHSMVGRDFLLKQCLFGEHLLNSYNKNAEVYIVESEKTAIICSLERPDKLFMATGGLQNLKPEFMTALSSRKIVMYPDKGTAFNRWDEKVKKDLFRFNVTISDSLEKNEKVLDGEDLADIIIRRKIDEINKKNSY